jgi:NADH-quinone oxidoreductase subunit I
MQRYIKNIWDSLFSTMVGLKITMEHMFAKKVTHQYPEKWHPVNSGEMPPNSRNRLFMDWEDCSGCNACARACPVNCIDIESVKVTPGDQGATPLKSGGKRGLWVTKYTIDFSKCCFCALCTEACPTSAVVTTQEFEYSAYDKKDLLYSFSLMNDEQIAEKKRMNEEYAAEQKRKKAAEAAAAAAQKKAEGTADDKAQA